MNPPRDIDLAHHVPSNRRFLGTDLAQERPSHRFPALDIPADNVPERIGSTPERSGKTAKSSPLADRRSIDAVSIRKLDAPRPGFHRVQLHPPVGFLEFDQGDPPVVTKGYQDPA